MHGRNRRRWRNGTRRHVLVRAGFLCELRADRGCTGHATTVHRRPEYGADHDDNLAAYQAACAHCHGVVDGARAAGAA